MDSLSQETMEPVPTTQSEGLSQRQQVLVSSGRHFTDDSKSSENVLKSAIATVKTEIQPLIIELFGPDAKLVIRNTMSLYELLERQKAHYPEFPKPSEDTKKMSIRPDGGIWFLETNKNQHPLLVLEDKKQGTNDSRFSKGLPKQALGNAIERFAKNVKTTEMLFHTQSIFPYVLFCSGCDFHSSESISGRILSANYGFPNHTIEISPTTTLEETQANLTDILTKVSIHKKQNLPIIQPFLKTHKYDEMPHNSSDWTKDERVRIISHILTASLTYYKESLA